MESAWVKKQVATIDNLHSIMQAVVSSTHTIAETDGKELSPKDFANHIELLRSKLSRLWVGWPEVKLIEPVTADLLKSIEAFVSGVILQIRSSWPEPSRTALGKIGSRVLVAMRTAMLSMDPENKNIDAALTSVEFPTAAKHAAGILTQLIKEVSAISTAYADAYRMLMSKNIAVVKDAMVELSQHLMYLQKQHAKGSCPVSEDEYNILSAEAKRSGSLIEGLYRLLMFWCRNCSAKTDTDAFWKKRITNIDALSESVDDLAIIMMSAIDPEDELPDVATIPDACTGSGKKLIEAADNLFDVDREWIEKSEEKLLTSAWSLWLERRKTFLGESASS